MSTSQYDLNESVAVIPDAPPTDSNVVPERTELANPLLARLLNIADCYRLDHAIRQAIEIYWELVEEYPETSEALQAREQLLRIGEQHEQAGEFHQARSLYERLL